MKRKVLKVLALTGFLTFGLVGASCGEDTPVVTDETTSNVVNVVLSGAKDLKVGETLTLTPHFDDGGNHDVTYISKDPDVASVDANGVVTALTTGQATIVCQISGVDYISQAKVDIDIRIDESEVAPEYVKATFVDYDGAVLYEDVVENGGTPTYAVTNPQRVSDTQNSYAFVGWDKDIGPITSDTTYQAVYETIPFTTLAFELDLVNGGYKVVGYSGSATDLEIPSTYSFRKVVSIGEDAFSGNSTLVNVTLPETIVEICENAFYNCSALRTINIPEGLAKLGEYSFYGCSMLESTITLGSAITEIPAYCFYNCSRLPLVRGHENVTTIGDCAFANCRTLNFDFNEGLISIGAFAFQHNKAMLDIVLPDTIVSLGTSVFCHCSTLSTIALPRNLETIEVGRSGTYTAQTLFLGCTNLTTISIAEDAPNFSVDENYVLYGANGTVLYSVAPAIPGEYTILDTCTTIMDNAFYGSSLRVVTIPGNVTTIEPETFWTSEVQEVIFESGIEPLEMSGSMFDGCDNLKIVTINREITELPSDLFRDLEELIMVTLPSTLEVIGSYAFYGCSNLISINMPDSVKEIGTYAFYNCSLLKFDLPASLETIGIRAFASCTGLEEVTIPDSVTSIGNYAFVYCTNLRTVTFGTNSQLKTLGTYVFDGCTALENVKLPGSVSSIGNYSFRNTENLKTFEFSEGITTIGSNAFNGSGIEELVLPNTVTKINASAFTNCDSLKTVVLSKALKGTSAIGASAFANDTAIETLTFGPGLTDEEVESEGWSIKFGSSALNNVRPSVINFRGSETAFAEVDFNNSGFETYLETGEVTINYNYEMDTTTVTE